MHSPTPLSAYSQMSRRSLLAGGGLLFIQPLVACSTASEARAQSASDHAAMPDLDELAARFPSEYPQFDTALEVLAKTGTTIEVGQGPNGRRRIIPITGGRFRGPGLSGTVIPGGADRQTVRADGVRELDAIYELQADDGTVLMVHNRVLIDAQQPPEGEQRYARSVIKVTAPEGPHDWLNRRILIGTLHSLRPAQPFVFLRFHILD